MLLGYAFGLIETTKRHQVVGQQAIPAVAAGIGGERLPDWLDRGFGMSETGVHLRERGAQVEVVRREFYGLFEFGFRAAEVAVKDQEQPTRSVCRRQVRVQGQGLVDRNSGRSQTRLCLCAAHILSQKSFRVSQIGISPRILWIKPDRILEKLDRLPIIRLGISLIVELSLEKSIVSREVAAGRTVTLGRGVARVEQLRL